jgi:hypothetical protein
MTLFNSIGALKLLHNNFFLLVCTCFIDLNESIVCGIMAMGGNYWRMKMMNEEVF